MTKKEFTNKILKNKNALDVKKSCNNCDGKGYNTKFVGKTTAFADFGHEFGGADRKTIREPYFKVVVCEYCDRGKQIQKYFDIKDKFK